MAGPVRDVVVVGRDAELWIAALGLHRAVGGTGVRVRAVELPSELGAAHAYAGLPSLATLHQLLGLPEVALFRACSAAPTLGRRFVDWRPGSAFLHAYDVARPTLDGVDLLQSWTKAHTIGPVLPLESFSLAAAAARAGRIGVEPGGPDTMNGFLPGLHMHARTYARLLRAGAVQNGIEIIPGPLGSVERDGDRIVKLVTAAGAKILADLFVDTSGAEAALIGTAPGGAWTSFSDPLKADRLVVASGPRLRPLPAYSEATAFSGGWASLLPLQDRTALVGVCVARGRSNGELVRSVADAAGLPNPVDATVRTLAQGARSSAWIGNCVALGVAVAQLEPLDIDALHLAQVGLSMLVSLWPVDAEMMPEASLYNQLSASLVSNLRDFTAAHYILNRRTGEPGWDRARSAVPSARLATKLDLFAARGLVPLYDDETFQEQDWSACFVGHGLIPRSWDARVDAMPDDEREAKFARLLQIVADDVARMPDVGSWIAVRSGLR